jgi:hypothetical protein
MTADHPRDGHVEGNCNAWSRQAGRPCQLQAGWGTRHVGYGYCRKHGGNTPTHETAAREAMASDAVRRYGLPVATTAVDALQAELDRSNGSVLWLDERVGELPAEEVPESPWPRLYLAERAHLRGVAVDAAKLGLEARRVAVDEQIVAFIVGRLHAFAAAMGWDPKDDRVLEAVQVTMQVDDAGAVQGALERAGDGDG